LDLGLHRRPGRAREDLLPDDHWFTPALETLTIHPTMNRSPEPGTVVPVG